MTKKLKIRFVKFEKALAMQILEQEGKFVWGNHIKTNYFPELSLKGEVYLRGKDRNKDLNIESMYFSSNANRDEYLAKVVGWITEEQFTSLGELKVGEMCEVKDDSEDDEWNKNRLLAILPEEYDYRYIFAEDSFERGWTFYRYARPLASCVQPKIDGDVYTWEMEVVE